MTAARAARHGLRALPAATWGQCIDEVLPSWRCLTLTLTLNLTLALALTLALTPTLTLTQLNPNPNQVLFPFLAELLGRCTPKDGLATRA